MDLTSNDLQIPLEVIRRGGETPRAFSGVALLEGLEIGLSKIDNGRVELELMIATNRERVEVTGSIRSGWTSECRRCLEEFKGSLDFEIKETFIPEKESIKSDDINDGSIYSSDEYVLGSQELNLEPLVRDAVLLAIPLSPLCSKDCTGSDPKGFSVLLSDQVVEDKQLIDSRWAILGEFKSLKTQTNSDIEEDI